MTKKERTEKLKEISKSWKKYEENEYSVYVNEDETEACLVKKSKNKITKIDFIDIT